MRPILRPGLRLLRRDPSTIQLGLDWPGLTLLHDSPALRAVLSGIDGFRDAEGVVRAAADAGADPVACRHALGRLVDSGAVVDADDRREPDVPESTWAAWSLLAGPHRRAADIGVSRRNHRVDVLGDGAVAAEVRQLLPATGIPIAPDRRTADVLVLASDSEPAREVSDLVMSSGLPHLWVGVRDLVTVVGPFVLPGESACLRCLDAARSDVDPAWSTIVHSLLARPARPAASEPVTVALAGAWAVRELTLWASGIRPPTCDHVVEVPFGSAVVDSVPTQRHPRCGCGWPERHDTIGA